MKKRLKEYMDELYDKDLNKLDYYNSVVSHPELDILECEVKRALGSIAVSKASACDIIPVELFKTLKHDAIEIFHSICQQIWKKQQWPQAWKRTILIPIPKKEIEVAQSCLTLCDPMDCSPQAPLSLGILQARLLEWDTMPSSRAISPSSPPRDRTRASSDSCIACGFFSAEPSGKPFNGLT